MSMYINHSISINITCQINPLLRLTIEPLNWDNLEVNSPNLSDNFLCNF